MSLKQHTPSALPQHLSQPIEKYLKKLSTDMVLACNSRHWDPKSYPWTHMSPDFTSGPTFATLPTTMNLPEFLLAFSALYDSIPEYYTQTMSIAVHPSDRVGEVQVFANFQNFNFTPGVIRYSIGLFIFREDEDGEWKCVYYRSLPGPTG